jgi:2,3-bisphosphoglycerate-dependent phosphoglycerate mutase
VITDIFLVRHGQPEHQPTIPYHTPPGPVLSGRGRAEARQAATFLLDKGVEYLFVSPFARTVQTAEILQETLARPQMVSELVQEHGPGESFDQVRSRIRELLLVANDSPYTRVALVSHGSPVRAMLLELSQDKIDLRQHVYSGGNPAPTCGIWHAQLLDERQWRFELAFKPD